MITELFYSNFAGFKFWRSGHIGPTCFNQNFASSQDLQTTKRLARKMCKRFLYAACSWLSALQASNAWFSALDWSSSFRSARGSLGLLAFVLLLAPLEIEEDCLVSKNQIKETRDTHESHYLSAVISRSIYYSAINRKWIILINLFCANLSHLSLSLFFQYGFLSERSAQSKIFASSRNSWFNGNIW